MSTRAVIARATDAGGWAGRYHHSDGYPHGLGRRLYAVARDLGVTRMLALLVDEHPAGWSIILGCDMRKEPGYRGLSDAYLAMTPEERIADDAAHGPQCYCHGGRRWESTLITDMGDDCDTEWCYAIHEARGEMTVYKRAYSPSRWTRVATVNLLSDGPEPDWDAMERTETPDSAL